MAADNLTKNWDGWMVDLSASYEKTWALLTKKDIAGAADEFDKQFVSTIKKLYKECEKTYPPKFKKINDWCGWARNLYRYTLETEKALKLGDKDEAEKKLWNLRNHFYNLHAETKTAATNDYLYALVKTMQGKDDIKKIKSLLSSLDKAPLSVKASAQKSQFNQKKAAFAKQFNDAASDNTIDEKEKPALLKSIVLFYGDFGMQFE